MPPRITASASLLIAYCCVTLAPLLWAGNFAVGRAAMGIDPFMLNVLRWMVAGLCLLPLLIWQISPVLVALRQRPLALILLALLGVVGFNSLLYSGLHDVSAGTAGLLFGLTPLFIMGLSRIWRGHGLPRRCGLGGALAFAGVIAVLGNTLTVEGMSWQGAGLVGLASMVFAGYTVALQRFNLPLRGDACLALTVWLGLLLMGPVTALRPESWPTPEQLRQVAPSVLYLGFGASVVAFFAWQFGVRELGPRRAGVFLQLVPVFGVGLGAIYLGEPVTNAKLAGLVCVVIGVVVAQTAPAADRSGAASGDAGRSA